MPDIPFPVKIKKRPTLELCSVDSGCSFYGRRHTSKTVVREVLSKISKNLAIAAYEIDSTELNEVISNHEHVCLSPNRLHTLLPTNTIEIRLPGSPYRVPVVVEMGFTRPLIMEHTWHSRSVPERVIFCCFAASRRSTSCTMTERTVKAVYMNIHVQIEEFNPKRDCSPKHFFAISGHTVPSQHICLAECSSLKSSTLLQPYTYTIFLTEICVVGGCKLL